MSRDLIFICFAREDNRDTDFRAIFVEQLNAVNLAQNENIVLDYFVDKQIQVGSKWRDEIKIALSKTRIALILEGPGLTQSEFVQTQELPTLLRAAKVDGVLIFRVPIRHVSKYAIPDGLKEFQTALPAESPLSSLEVAKRDKAISKIVDALVEEYIELGNEE